MLTTILSSDRLNHAKKKNSTDTPNPDLVCILKKNKKKQIRVNSELKFIFFYFCQSDFKIGISIDFHVLLTHNCFS